MEFRLIEADYFKTKISYDQFPVIPTALTKKRSQFRYRFEIFLKRSQNERTQKTSGSTGNFSGGNGRLAWIEKEQPGHD